MKEWAVGFAIIFVIMGVLALFINFLANKQHKEKCNPMRISVEFLRSNHIKERLKDIDATQFLGEAESGIRGNNELYDKIEAEAARAYPDKYEYYQTVGSKHLSLDGFVSYGNTDFGNYYRVIYIKEKK